MPRRNPAGAGARSSSACQRLIPSSARGHCQGPPLYRTSYLQGCTPLFSSPQPARHRVAACAHWGAGHLRLWPPLGAQGRCPQCALGAGRVDGAEGGRTVGLPMGGHCKVVRAVLHQQTRADESQHRRPAAPWRLGPRPPLVQHDPLLGGCHEGPCVPWVARHAGPLAPPHTRLA